MMTTNRHRFPLAFSVALTLLLMLCFSPAAASTRTQLDTALQLMHDGRYGSALTILHDLEQRLSNPAQIAQVIGSAYLGLGYQHLKQRNDQAALEMFERGRDYVDNDPRLWLGEGTAAYLLGQYDVAENALLQAIALDEENANAYLVLGQVYYAEGFLYDALEMLEQSRELSDSPAVRELLSKVRRDYEIEQDMERDLEGMFQISFADDGQSALAADILDALNDAYTELGSQMNFFPDVRVPVLLYTRQDFSAVTRSPDWAGAVYDGKIRIPLGGVRHMTPQLRALLYHEYAHVVVHYLGKGRLPTWLNEGFAELAGRWIDDRPMTEFAAAIDQDRLLSWTQLDKPFAELPAGQVPLAYQQSRSMVSHLVDHFGWHNLRDLFQLLGRGIAFEQAFAQTYEEFGVTWPEVDREWALTHQHR